MSLTVRLPNAAAEYFALPPSNYVDAKNLAAGAAETLAIPADAKYAMFSSTGDFFAAYDATATVPGDTADGSAPELNPTMRYINGRRTISVIAPADCKVTVSYYL